MNTRVVKGFVSCSDCGICLFFLTADEWDFRVEKRDRKEPVVLFGNHCVSLY